MELLLIFAATLVAGVLISDLADRSVISVAVLFLLSGFLFGEHVLGVIRVGPNDPLIGGLMELALFGVLFTDGMRSGFQELRGAWRLPGRALLLGMPLTMALFAGLGHLVVGLPWSQALLVGAILSPTDPIFAAAIVGRESVPHRLRYLLNVESGLNDGLALPAVVALLESVSAEQPNYGQLLGQVAGGVAVGAAIPWVVVQLGRTRFFKSRPQYDPLNAFGIGLAVLAAAKVSHVNEFLAAFSAGVTIASTDPRLRDSFHRFGELVTELLKLAALLLFGALISPGLLANNPSGDYFFVLAALFAVRPLALAISLFGCSLRGKERLAAMWFGPRGFASVVYSLMLFHHGVPPEVRDPLFHLIALVVVTSMVAHSSTDVLLARWLGDHEEGRHEEEGGPPKSEAEARAEREPDESQPEEERVH